MILDVVKFGTPVLRKKGERIEKVTPEIVRLIADMFETMYAAKGIGLAAQQVGRALQLTVIDVRGATERPSTLEIGGQPVDVEEHMPMVLINPEFKAAAEPIPGPEGCLSFPEIYADISRPAIVDVKALDKDGRPVSFRCGGLLGRAVQHETDHLHGILFIDRMDKATKENLREELEVLQHETKEALKRKKAGA